jgi:hypothetical protein
MSVMDASLVRDIAAFTDALGVENAPMIMGFALVPWPSDDERNEFIRELTGISIRELNDYE